MYVKNEPNEFGNHGNPSSIMTNGMAEIPDNLLLKYTETLGFANLAIVEGVVTDVEINQEAYDAYQESLPEPEPQPDPMTQDEIESMLLDQEYRLLLLEYVLEEEEPI